MASKKTNTRDTRPELAFVSPDAVVIDVNVRKLPELRPGFVQDIRENGLLQPPVGWRDDDGTVHVTIGQRRTLAAQEIGLAEIPVLLKPRQLAEDEAAAERIRIVDQLGENYHREALPDADQYAAEVTLFDLGMSADEVARALHRKRDRVRKSYKLHQSDPGAGELMREHELTLDVAAEISVYREHPDIVEQLSAVAKTNPTQLIHQLKEAEEEVARRTKLAEVRAEIEGKGWRFMSEGEFEAHVQAGVQAWELEELVLADGTASEGPEQAHEMGGFIVSAYWGHDWTQEAGHVWGWHLLYYVENPGEHGYFVDENGEPAYPEDTEPGEVPAEDPELAERQRLQAERAEAWKSAAEVRQEWLRGFLAQSHKSAPADAWWLITQSLMDYQLVTVLSSASPEWFSIMGRLLVEPEEPVKGHSSIMEVLGDRLQEIIAREPARGWVVPLAMTLARAERHTVANGLLSEWYREPIAQYLELLQSWGYPLSEVEQDLVVADRLERESAVAALVAEADSGEES